MGEGSTEILVEIGNVKKACKVTVRPMSPELTGKGETLVIVDDDFEASPTFNGDNTYCVGDSLVDVDSNNWYSFKSNGKPGVENSPQPMAARFPCLKVLTRT